VDTTHVGVTTSDEASAAVRSLLAGQPVPGNSLLGGLLDAVIPPFLPPPVGD
jgi:hypothetical protein